MQTWVFIHSRMLTPNIRDAPIPIAEPLGGATSPPTPTAARPLPPVLPRTPRRRIRQRHHGADSSAARLACWFLNWGGTIVIEGDTTLPGVEMKSGTIFVKGAVLEVLPSYKDEGTEEVDGVAYQKYAGDLSRNGEGVLYVSV